MSLLLSESFESRETKITSNKTFPEPVDSFIIGFCLFFSECCIWEFIIKLGMFLPGIDQACRSAWTTSGCSSLNRPSKRGRTQSSCQTLCPGLWMTMTRPGRVISFGRTLRMSSSLSRCQGEVIRLVRDGWVMCSCHCCHQILDNLMKVWHFLNEFGGYSFIPKDLIIDKS